MLKLNLCRGVSRKFFYEANGLALSVAMLLFFSCTEETPISNELEPEDVSVKEYAFINPDDTLNISLCEAEDIATLFMNELGGVDNTFKSAGAHHSSRKTFVIPDDNLEPAVYAINLDPDGFCIVAATKKTETILAYSEQGKFDPDNLPIGVADWLGERIEIIQEIRGDASFLIPPTHSNSSNRLRPQTGKETNDACGSNTTTTYGPLLKTTWGQDYPYNYQCPAKATCEHSLAGCVAIAAAQVVRYWKPDASSYSWEEMPNSASYKVSTDYLTKNNGYSSMTRFIHEIGIALNMEYECRASYAYTSDIPGVLSREYKFNSCGKYQIMDITEAEAKVISNIKNKQPVIMNGKATQIWNGSSYIYGNGHAWVCDGYKKVKNQNLFHMNWGWNGDCNGWYTIGLSFAENDKSSSGACEKYVYLRGFITDIKARQ